MHTDGTLEKQWHSSEYTANGTVWTCVYAITSKANSVIANSICSEGVVFSFHSPVIIFPVLEELKRLENKCISTHPEFQSPFRGVAAVCCPMETSHTKQVYSWWESARLRNLHLHNYTFSCRGTVE